jgi:hypothetical protein
MRIFTQGAFAFPYPVLLGELVRVGVVQGHAFNRGHNIHQHQAGVEVL